MFLIVVTDMNPGSQSDRSGVRWKHGIDQFQECGFAGAVVADDGNTFSPFDLPAPNALLIWLHDKIIYLLRFSLIFL